jgi:hypothetical protein
MGLAAPAAAAAPPAADEGTPWINVDWDQFLGTGGEGSQPTKGGGDAVDQAINAGMNQGAADTGAGVPAGNGEPSWVSQNWPWLLVGGIGVATVAIVAGTVLTSGDKTIPAPRSVPALPPHAAVTR